MKRFLLLSILIAGLLIACNKDNDEKNKFDYSKGESEAYKDDCLKIQYPITFIMPDGVEIVIGSEMDKEAWLEIDEWYEANPGSQEKAELQYPINATFKGESIIIPGDEKMNELKKLCANKKKVCFVILYPQTFAMPDATTITVESKEDMESWQEIKEWYNANPGSEEKPTYVYPIKVKMIKDGVIKSIYSDEELIELKKYCDPTK